MKRSILREIVLFVACAVFVGTVGLILLDSVIMPRLVRKNQQVQVPNIVDMTRQQAARSLARYGLTLKMQDPRWDPNVQKDHVVIQNPEAFSLVKPGRTVYAFPSKGTRLFTVPNLRGKKERQAKLLVQQNGLLFGEVVEEPSETVPEDLVIRQDPEVGRQVGAGSTVYIVLSNGPPRESVLVPKLVGRKLDVARRTLSKATLKIKNVRYRFSTAYVPDTVVEDRKSVV